MHRLSMPGSRQADIPPLGLDEQDANAFLPFKVRTTRSEHINAFFKSFDARSLLTGVGPADVHNRDPRDLPLITEGATVIGDGVLAQAAGMNVVFCQLLPWQFQFGEQSNLKRTYRRSSYLVTRLLANMNVDGDSPVLKRFSTPVSYPRSEKRCATGSTSIRPRSRMTPTGSSVGEPCCSTVPEGR